MKIKFDPGAEGFHEAEVLRAMVRHYLRTTEPGGRRAEFLHSLEELAQEHMESPEFDGLRAHLGEQGDWTLPPVEPSLGSRLRGLFSALTGPSRREMELSRQRIEALDRAQRAEIASFEALAETAQVARERDALREELKALKASLEDADKVSSS